MDTGIGPTLREARNRRKLHLSEVEAAIKIRARYLQAMENEEWDALPGGAYTRGFIRTYAAYLGLDGERLADDYRQAASPGSDRVPKRIEPVPASARRGGSKLSGGALLALVALALVALLVAVGLLSGGGDSSAPRPRGGEVANKRHDARSGGATTAEPGVVMRLAATGEVWVCVLGAGETPLVDGEILEAGAKAGPFRSGRFEIALGNGAVRMFVDGKRADVPESSSPVGYRVDSNGELAALEEGERPSCE